MTLRQATRGRLLLACSAALLAAGLLNACAAPESGLQREAAKQLQARVLEVAQASSQNDPASALKALEGLESDLSAARAKGQVSEERRRSITTVATAGRADLNEAVAAQQAAAKAAEDSRIAAGQSATSPSPTAEAPATDAAPAPVPAQDSAAGNGGDAGKSNNGDKGKGKN